MLSSSGTRNSQRIEVAGQWFAVLVVLAPVTGAIMRWIAFSFDPAIPDALRAAINAPLQELIATSAAAVVPALLVLGASLPLMVGPSGPEAREQADSPPSRLDRVMSRIATGRGVIALMAVAAIFASPYLFANLLGSLAAGMLIGRVGRSEGRTDFEALLPALLAVAVGSAVSGGLGLTLRSADWTFSDASVALGRYVEVGSAENRIVLRDCRTGALVEIQSSAVTAKKAVVALPDVSRGSLFWWTQGEPLTIGIAYRC